MSLPDIPWDFLRTASVQSLEDFELTRLNHVDLLKKRLRAQIDEIIAEQSAANVARMLIESWRFREMAGTPPIQVSLFPDGKEEAA